jgi:putative DNA primase/helicase
MSIGASRNRSNSEFLPEALIERARQYPIDQIADQHGLELRGKNNRSGPCPHCGGTDRFSINLKKRLFYCRRCERGGDVIELVRFITGITFPQAVIRLAGLPVSLSRHNEAHRAERERDQEDDALRIKQAQGLWSEGVTPLDTPAQKYLAARKLLLPQELCNSVLRFHGECPWSNEAGEIEHRAVLLATFRRVDTGQLTAVHRILVDEPQRWPKTKRRMLGVVSGAAIKLGSPVNGLLAIAEGVENAMAANQLSRGPAWAVGSVGAIKDFNPPTGIIKIKFVGENDKANRPAAYACAERLRAIGIECTYLRPPKRVKDFNDILLEG